jgi:hypothetical protein
VFPSGLTPNPETVLTFIIKTSEVLGSSNLKFMEICALTGKWLNDLCYDHNLFSDCYSVFRSDRVSVNKTLCGGVLNALSSRYKKNPLNQLLTGKRQFSDCQI